MDLVAEWSTDFGFLTYVHEFGRVAIPAAGDEFFDALIPDVHEFHLPLDRLAPDGHYFMRAYFGGVELELPSREPMREPPKFD